MKTTRVLGFVAGLVAVVALIALGVGAIAGMTKLGFLSLMVGMVLTAVALVLGIVHFLLRIKFRDPYRRRRGPQAFARAGRVMVWVWGVAMIAIGAITIIYLGPIMLALISR